MSDKTMDLWATEIRKAEEDIDFVLTDPEAPPVPAQYKEWADTAVRNCREAIARMKRILASEKDFPNYDNSRKFWDARTDAEIERGLYLEAREGECRDARTIRSLEAIVAVRKDRILHGEVVPATVTGTMKALIEETFDELLKTLEETARSFRGYFVRGLADSMDSEMVRFVLVRNRIDWLAESLDRHC